MRFKVQAWRAQHSMYPDWDDVRVSTDPEHGRTLTFATRKLANAYVRRTGYADLATRVVRVTPKTEEKMNRE